MFLVGVGGIIGAISRFVLGKWITSKASSAFPFGTWIINISGSFILGILAVLHFNNAISEGLWLLFCTGFLGAYTTFSTFGYETILMLQKKDTRNAVIYISTSVLLGVIFAWIGGSITHIIL
ncbi:fluoride efflux transporter CrcB [Thermosediminibacter oceani]|uniref:Fluoride-specific ion channel FluC n=1 Tax=Thermosediminibacter oceani (strain ATCC BAA-1034 / DSM 16646 / JW/IW-1228P) TaxID=555079 RepID=D9S1E4_THEOJ|nr:fluoride efflux transporter CrcB [Thermosediminibacter oceani]ADL07221.1 CrcB protein [Thermosediminibacter oceani DSM 16646]